MVKQWRQKKVIEGSWMGREANWGGQGMRTWMEFEKDYEGEWKANEVNTYKYWKGWSVYMEDMEENEGSYKWMSFDEDK